MLADDAIRASKGVKFTRDCRSILISPFYQRLFQTRLESQRAALQELITTQGGFRLATSVNGVLTGRGADIIIIDDPLKPSMRCRTVVATLPTNGTMELSIRG
jgi:hypothetical protein